jgi:predicted RecA/RadA family phage recombinase
MATNYVQRGDVMDFTAAGTIAAGAVVKMGHTLGIALVAMTSGQTGAVQVEGVFTVPKVSGAVFAAGEKLLWDVSAAAFDDSAATPASGDVMGAAIAFAPGADGETTCRVKLTPGNATLTA